MEFYETIEKRCYAYKTKEHNNRRTDSLGKVVN